jgi:uncharacterized protein YcfJ
MKAVLTTALAVAALGIATQAAAQVTFFEREGFQGRSFSTDREIHDFARFGFNDRASSLVIDSGAWAVCEEARFAGRCVVLGPGRYTSLIAMSMNNRISSVRPKRADEYIGDNFFPPAPGADRNAAITFYEGEHFEGRSFTSDREIENFRAYGFNHRAASMVVHRGGWAVCTGFQFGGQCAALAPGRYPTLFGLGFNERVMSMRPRLQGEPVAVYRNEPGPAPVSEYRRRHDERLYDAKVISVRAVVGPPEQRCWVEREQVVQERSGPNVPGAVAGAVIGGIIGHQVGSGRGNDLATVGGAVAGAAMGANVGRDSGQQVVTQNVQRCASVPSQGRPQYWDVVYNFFGQDHHVQMTAPPGPTVLVNERGEPRE